MATTISGPSVTDDSGTPAAPVGDGTLFDAAFFTSFYAAINAMWSGATNVLGGVLTLESRGVHTFSAGGAGPNTLQVRNTDAGAGNRGSIEVGNDSDADIGRLEAYASNYTETGVILQEGVALRSFGAGGTTISAEFNAGTIKLVAFGTSKTITFDGDTLESTAGDLGTHAYGGVLQDSRNTTTVGNVGGGEDDLHTFSLPAGALSADGQCVQFEAWGTYAANGNVKTVLCYFGSTPISTPETSGAVVNGNEWYVTCKIWRTGASTQDAVGAYISRDSYVLFSNPAETLSGTVVIKVTGESGSSATNDVVCERSEVTFHP